MTEKIWPPFSARNRGAHAQIDDQCPESTRVGLLHIVLEAASKHYVEDQQTVIRELERIARVRRDAFSEIDNRRAVNAASLGQGVRFL